MVRQIFSTCIFLAVFCLISPGAHALEVSRTVSPNGLLVLHSEKHALPLVMLTLLVKAGQILKKEEWIKNGFFEVVNSRTNEVMRLDTSLLKDIENKFNDIMKDYDDALQKNDSIVNGSFILYFSFSNHLFFPCSRIYFC